MLAGVLLHVVEAARPIDASRHCACGEGLIDNVDNIFAVVANVDHSSVPDGAHVVRLPARRWVKGSAVQHNFPRGLRTDGRGRRPRYAAYYLSFEMGLKGIVVINTLRGHLQAQCSSI